MPVLFLSHGSPTLAFDDVPARDFLVRLGAKLPRPKAILCISAHWEAAVPTVTGSETPSTIHDFYGFPQALYDLRYDAPGDPHLRGARAVKLLEDGGFKTEISADRGLDHGVWSPLILAYPQSGIPVVQLSPHASPHAGRSRGARPPAAPAARRRYPASSPPVARFTICGRSIGTTAPASPIGPAFSTNGSATGS